MKNHIQCHISYQIIQILTCLTLDLRIVMSNGRIQNTCSRTAYMFYFCSHFLLRFVYGQRLHDVFLTKYRATCFDKTFDCSCITRSHVQRLLHVTTSKIVTLTCIQNLCGFVLSSDFYIFVARRTHSIIINGFELISII